MNIDALRDDTPGCTSRIHLNNAGAALMPQPVIDRIKSYIDLEAETGGYEAQAASSEAVDAAYRAIATLLGARERNIAFTENATASYAQALSSIAFKKGDVLLTTRHDYSSNQIQFLALRKRYGIEVLRAPDCERGGVDTALMSDLIRKRKPALVCVTEVPTNSGLVQDVRTIGEVCAQEEVIYLVDACQSVGQMPTDVMAMHCDFLSATARKFLRGPRGCGFLYVSDRLLDRHYEPLFIDMHGANWVAADRYAPVDSARRFENWEFSWALVLATGVAVDYALAIGLDPIRRRVSELANGLRSGLTALKGVTVLDRGERLGGIVTAALHGHDPFEVVTRLRQQGINTSAQGREYAVIDFDAKQVQAALRISPHYYNTEAEIETVLHAIDAL